MVMRNKIIPYNPALKHLARQLRKESTPGEILLWKRLRNKSLDVEFHRQVPIDHFIVDFYCHELLLAIEIDGSTHIFEEVAIRDQARQERLEQLGVSFIRFTEKEIGASIDGVIKRLSAHIDFLMGI